MIKVIEENPDPSVVKQVVCRNCGVKLEYTPNDTKEETRTDYTGSSEIYTIIECPRCNKKVKL